MTEESPCTTGILRHCVPQDDILIGMALLFSWGIFLCRAMGKFTEISENMQ